ncbi:Crp/Fnr family transcriptional regulator [Parvularcula sp. LCG005]|uniref:Crp/Fnr family transcriptional regulator n=1 Tax=Parvularcula sp. LCG005 TaxID=3078805 RepID=UPI0029426170|nr:Crp/Fnr family transcriptional regulator [Parvularcula sp. LCG005]WOI52911.1 Crp/Fnr family transcriptional regulator [Parvularcula sp. LCG005]
MSQYVSLPDDEWKHLFDLSGKPVTYEAHQDIIRAGENAETVFYLQSGWALRYRMLDDGRRQIINFMLPGDVFDLQSLGNLAADHSVTTVVKTEVVQVPSRSFLRMLRRSADLAAAFWWASVQEESILREQIVRIGRRSARERIGHLLLELQRRLNGANGEEMDDVELPITRVDLADALGLTPVHVSRTLSAMRRAGLIDIVRSRIAITDGDRLARLAHFDTDYLHLRSLDLSQKMLNGSSPNGNGVDDARSSAS